MHPIVFSPLPQIDPVILCQDAHSLLPPSPRNTRSMLFPFQYAAAAHHAIPFLKTPGGFEAQAGVQHDRVRRQRGGSGGACSVRAGLPLGQRG